MNTHALGNCLEAIGRYCHLAYELLPSQALVSVPTTPANSGLSTLYRTRELSFTPKLTLLGECDNGRSA